MSRSAEANRFCSRDSLTCPDRRTGDRSAGDVPLQERAPAAAAGGSGALESGLLPGRVAVVPEVRHELAFGDVPNPGRDPVDEEPVVRNENDRPVIRGQHLLERFPRLDIEMVGWLVQDQQVRTLDEETCQCEPRTFPSGERGDRTMHLISPKQETR